MQTIAAWSDFSLDAQNAPGSWPLQELKLLLTDVQVNEWVYDVNERQRKVHANRGFSPFMEKFLESNYNKPGIA